MFSGIVENRWCVDASPEYISDSALLSYGAGSMHKAINSLTSEPARLVFTRPVQHMFGSMIVMERKGAEEYSHVAKLHKFRRALLTMICCIALRIWIWGHSPAPQRISCLSPNILLVTLARRLDRTYIYCGPQIYGIASESLSNSLKVEKSTHDKSGGESGEEGCLDVVLRSFAWCLEVEKVGWGFLWRYAQYIA